MSKKKQRYPQPIEGDVPPTPRGPQIKIRHQIKPRNTAQQLYLENLRSSPLTISNGPAGVGKTFLVTAIALEKLLNNEVGRIVITRPVVEADEKLGFLPGSLEEKLDPYLKPIYDAIQDHVGPTMAKRLLESERLEIAPLAYMRGRTFNNAYVILDEAQNATVKQMKMFLTRLGEDSFCCIDGDVTQSDLAKPRDHAGVWENGLQYAIRKLVGKADQIAYNCFYNQDIIRSTLVQTIVDLLDAPDERRETIDATTRTNGQTIPSVLIHPAARANGHAAL
jgi:phosphate starvation-inducible protein PhoH and related proteins